MFDSNVIYSKFVLHVTARYSSDFLLFFRIKERSRGVCTEKYCSRLVNDFIDDDFLYTLYVYIISIFVFHTLADEAFIPFKPKYRQTPF